MPCWMGRVSPVFDVAKRLLVVDVEDATELSREYRDISHLELLGRPRYVADLGVQAFICGALSVPLRLILEAKGVNVVDQICGPAEEVLQAFLGGHLDDPAFLMPGARGRIEDFGQRIKHAGSRTAGKRRLTRIAVTSEGPNLESRVDLRFGRARYLIIVDAESGEYKVLDNSRNLNTAQGAGIQTASLVVDEKVEAVVSGHIGPRALEALRIARIQVFPSVSGTVAGVLQQLRARGS
ncbi:MAG: NifB/NifX family molybdenum-iron cluster-binding protein [Acidobacteriota bacterium]|jgi:predicted Fe-Mo cluster-binding NifX family protein